MNSRVKVQTDLLLAAVKARRERAVKEHETNLRKYERELGLVGGRIAKALRDAADKAERGDLPEVGYRAIEVPWTGRRPDKPTLNLTSIDRTISTLEMAADPTITVSAEDVARYLG